MAQIKIEELYRGEKYDIMGVVTARALLLGVDERTAEGFSFCDRETYIPVHVQNSLGMKKQSVKLTMSV